MKRMPIALFVSVTALVFSACATTAPETMSPSATLSPAKARAMELVKGETAAASPAPSPSPSPTAAPQGDTVSAAAVADSTPSPEELKFLDNYLAGLKYMVYYDQDSGVTPKQAKDAIAQANRYLIEKLKVQAVDQETVEKRKADELAAWKQETGQEVDYLQFIAQKLNADVYIELAFSVTPETVGSRYYATTTGSAKFYNASTGELLGSFPMTSPKVMSPDSQDAAVSNAINASVWLTMPRITDQARELLHAAWKDGIRYDITVQSTADAKAIGQLKRELGRKFRRVTQDSYSAAETRWAVYTFKGPEAIEQTLYDASAVVGMRDLYLVFQRGKAFVFNTGL